MAEITRVLDANTAAVWAVLSDGHSYADWVVGAAKIRAVDDDWPREGSKLHHTVGLLPIHFKDNTEVKEVREGEYLRLRARVRPLGTARISFELKDQDGKTEVTMIEVVDRGLAAKFYGFFMKAAINTRNIETLRRLESEAQKRRPAHSAQ